MYRTSVCKTNEIDSSSTSSRIEKLALSNAPGGIASLMHDGCLPAAGNAQISNLSILRNIFQNCIELRSRHALTLGFRKQTLIYAGEFAILLLLCKMSGPKIKIYNSRNSGAHSKKKTFTLPPSRVHIQRFILTYCFFTCIDTPFQITSSQREKHQFLATYLMSLISSQCALQFVQYPTAKNSSEPQSLRG